MLIKIFAVVEISRERSKNKKKKGKGRKLSSNKRSQHILLHSIPRSRMELLPDGQKNTATEVSWEDQQKINKFSSLITQKDELSDLVGKYKTEKEYIEDLSMEIELLDEDEKIQYKVGEVFVFMKAEKATSRIEKENEKLDLKINEFNDQIDEIDEKLNTLKKSLYAKFGNNINLER